MYAVGRDLGEAAGMRRLWRRGLAALGGVAAVAVLFNALYGLFYGEVSQVLWDYAIDPVVLAVIGLIVLVNVADSLRARGQAANHLVQLPRDVITALVAVVWVRYLIQYGEKIAPEVEAAAGLWGHLDALVIVILSFEAISLWRSASQTSRRTNPA